MRKDVRDQQYKEVPVKQVLTRPPSVPSSASGTQQEQHHHHPHRPVTRPGRGGGRHGSNLVQRIIDGGALLHQRGKEKEIENEKSQRKKKKMIQAQQEKSQENKKTMVPKNVRTKLLVTRRRGKSGWEEASLTRGSPRTSSDYFGWFLTGTILYASATRAHLATQEESVLRRWFGPSLHQNVSIKSKKLRLGRIEWDPVPGAQAYRVIEADGDAGGKEALLYCGSMTACVVEVAARKAYQIYALGENGAAGDPYTFTFASPSSASRPKQKQKQKQKNKGRKPKVKRKNTLQTVIACSPGMVHNVIPRALLA